jgi:hypothetical protein
MPSIEITDEQHERFAALRDELAAAHAGEYASVQPTDVMAYLLDIAEATDDPTAALDDDSETDIDTTAVAGDEGTGNVSEETGDTSVSDQDVAGEEATGALGGGPGMLNLLEEHDGKWREADDDARYEVDLPDGGTEMARTRDDVKAVLFKHHR